MNRKCDVKKKEKNPHCACVPVCESVLEAQVRRVIWCLLLTQKIKTTVSYIGEVKNSSMENSGSARQVQLFICLLLPAQLHDVHQM